MNRTAERLNWSKKCGFLGEIPPLVDGTRGVSNALAAARVMQWLCIFPSSRQETARGSHEFCSHGQARDWTGEGTAFLLFWRLFWLCLAYAHNDKPSPAAASEWKLFDIYFLKLCRPNPVNNEPLVMVSCGGLFCHDTAGFLVRSGKSGVPRLIGRREIW